MLELGGHPLGRLVPLGLVALVLLVLALGSVQMRTSVGVAVVSSCGARGARRTAPSERRLLGVVEEVALAARLPCPVVFVFDREDGINALSACSKPTDAAIAVTRGALEQLSRAELQAMVAHELTHVMQGDMRLDLRRQWIQLAILDVCRRLEETLLFPFVKLFLEPLTHWLGDKLVARGTGQSDVLADATAVKLLCDPVSLASCLRKIAADPERGRLRSCGSALREISFVGDPTGDEPNQPRDRLETRIRALQTSFGVA